MANMDWKTDEKTFIIPFEWLSSRSGLSALRARKILIHGWLYKMSSRMELTTMLKSRILVGTYLRERGEESGGSIRKALLGLHYLSRQQRHQAATETPGSTLTSCITAAPADYT